jgi:Lrp/AsnC family leucine-responsive transcriptional regulator
MPLRLDTIDIAVLRSLLADGRKSFRQISRETKISTPTVKARYERLVRIGLIKAVVPFIDTGMLENKTSKQLDLVRQKALHNHRIKIDDEMLVKMSCDYCEGPVHEKPHILKVGNFERFFCCPSCRTLYKEKYKYKIQSLSAASI